MAPEPLRPTECHLARSAKGIAIVTETPDGERVDLSVEIVDRGIARLTVGCPSPTLPRRSLARPSALALAPDVTLDDRGAVLRGDGIEVLVCREPFALTFLDARGVALVASAPVERNVGGVVSQQPLSVGARDGRATCRMAFGARPDEQFYGMGETFGSLGKRGRRFDLWHEDPLGVHTEGAYKHLPFVLSDHGYAVFVDTTTRSVFDLALEHHSSWSVAVDEPVLDLYVLAAAEPNGLIERFCSLVGYPQAPPRWAFGYWLSSGFLHDSHQQAMDRAQRFREHQLPADVFHLDCYWQRDRHLGDLVWDEQAFPEPSKTIAEIRHRGYRVSLWLTPYPAVGTDLFDEAARQGYLLQHARGEPYVLDLWAGTQPEVGIVDFAQPAATEWYAGRLAPLLRLGADALETDMGEGVPEDALSPTGLTGRELHNLYPLLWNDAVARAFQLEGRPPMLWGRSSYVGGQRHHVKWGGDPVCSFEAMASTLRGGLSLGICGHPYWSHDIGGLYGRPSTRLFVRWLQFGFLSGFARAHGTTSRLPWEYGDDVVELFRQYAALRYRLLPYLYTAAVESERTGTPMMQAMPIAFPHDRGAAGADLQYLLGNDLLIAPVFDETDEREVYIPPGGWVDHWTGGVLEGPRWTRMAAPLERLPILVRSGALVPTIKPRQSMGDEPFADVTFEAYDMHAGTSEAVLHDVDGHTRLRATFDGHRVSGELSGAKAHVDVCRMFVLGSDRQRIARD